MNKQLFFEKDIPLVITIHKEGFDKISDADVTRNAANSSSNVKLASKGYRIINIMKFLLFLEDEGKIDSDTMTTVSSYSDYSFWMNNNKVTFQHYLVPTESANVTATSKFSKKQSLKVKNMFPVKYSHMVFYAIDRMSKRWIENNWSEPIQWNQSTHAHDDELHVEIIITKKSKYAVPLL